MWSRQNAMFKKYRYYKGFKGWTVISTPRRSIDLNLCKSRIYRGFSLLKMRKIVVLDRFEPFQTVSDCWKCGQKCGQKIELFLAEKSPVLQLLTLK
uniref:Uncharacterized protein n=1 Tax=virus sp. ctmTa7 TaxID=2828255 RepID=A0A8S5RCU6_9VIRU|nr:MAG TPA: hypothetical protein [virus sp. ctmTa7]